MGNSQRGFWARKEKVSRCSFLVVCLLGTLRPTAQHKFLGLINMSIHFLLWFGCKWLLNIPWLPAVLQIGACWGKQRGVVPSTGRCSLRQEGKRSKRTRTQYLRCMEMVWKKKKKQLETAVWRPEGRTFQLWSPKSRIREAAPPFMFTTEKGQQETWQTVNLVPMIPSIVCFRWPYVAGVYAVLVSWMANETNWMT